MTIEYLYKCVKCKKVIPITKGIKDCGKEEHCPFCHMPMNRLYTPPIIFGDTSVKEQTND